MKVRVQFEIEALGAHCRQCRLAHKPVLTMGAVAQSLGCAKSKISRLEKGNGWGLDVDELLRLLEVINSPLHRPLAQAVTDFEVEIASLPIPPTD